jgi:2'-5' RNA ligase
VTDAGSAGRRPGRDPRDGRHPVGHAEPDDPDRPRLFFAVPLPDDVREGIRPIRDAVQAAVGDGHARIRWVRIESLHLTLRFLGPTPLERALVLGQAASIAAAEVPAFDVTIGGAGAFPADGRPRTLWLGLQAGVEGLARLASGIDRAMAGSDGPTADWQQLGRGDRPFTPHLTIARTDGLRAGADAARRLIEVVGDRSWGFRADRIVLYRSHLGRGPAWYEPLSEARLVE